MDEALSLHFAAWGDPPLPPPLCLWAHANECL